MYSNKYLHLEQPIVNIMFIFFSPYSIIMPRTSPWIDHVRQYVVDNGGSYACAITKAGATYEKKGRQPKKKTKNQELIKKRAIIDKLRKAKKDIAAAEMFIDDDRFKPSTRKSSEKKLQQINVRYKKLMGDLKKQNQVIESM
jgi:hypothetical protein